MNRVLNKVYEFILIVYYKIIYKKSFIVGKKLRFRKGFLVRISKNKKATLRIGNNCFFNSDCHINVHNNIIIEDNCIFGENVKVYDHNHKFNNLNIPIYKQGFSEGTVIIREGCWIASNVVILKGSDIGQHCVIGAGSIISGKIPKNSIIKTVQSLSIEKIEHNEG